MTNRDRELLSALVLKVRLFSLRQIAEHWWDGELADAWHGEDMLAHTRRGEKLPDAFILNDQGQPVSFVEFGGAYDARRVEEFHFDCASRGLPYQIW